MKITFCCTGTKPEPWLAGLRSALPGAEVTVWEPGAPPDDHAPLDLVGLLHRGGVVGVGRIIGTAPAQGQDSGKNERQARHIRLRVKLTHQRRPP